MQSLVTVATLLSVVSAGYIPAYSAPYGKSNVTHSSISSGSGHHPKPTKGHNETEIVTTTTEIVYTTVTTCPAGQTITWGGKPTVLPTDYLSTIYTTTTKTICPKCTEGPWVPPPGGYGSQQGGSGQGGSPWNGGTYGGSSGGQQLGSYGYGSSGSNAGGSQSSGSNGYGYGSSGSGSGSSGQYNHPPPEGSGHGPHLPEILGNGNCYPPGMNPGGCYLPGKNPYGHGGKPPPVHNGTVTIKSTSKSATVSKSTTKASVSGHSYSHSGSVSQTSATYSASHSVSASKSASSSGSKSSSASVSSTGSKSASSTGNSTPSSSVSYSSKSSSQSQSSLVSSSGSKSASSSGTSSQSSASGTITSSSSVTSSASLSSSTASSSTSSSSSSSASALPSCYFWMENIKHQGISAFGPSGYTVFRNVKDYGAKGDGVNDDTAAINAAMSDGGRCAPGSCASSTLTPAVVYFPAGTYLVSAPIIDYYYTQIIGNPNCMPIIKASSGFSGAWVIDGDQYQAGGVLGFGSTNIFWRQIRNFVIDMTSVPASSALVGIHWPTAQATSLQNIVFKMSEAVGTQHEGVFIESGSGGFMTDLTFYGGNIAAYWGNQQFTTRNLTFYNAVTAINQLWDWGWTYKSITVENCTIALNISGLNNGAQAVGSVVMIDSSISNTEVGVVTARTLNNNNPVEGGSMILENVVLNNVGTAIQSANGNTILAGGSGTIDGFGQGNAYTPTGPQTIQQTITPNSRPASLISGSPFLQTSGGAFYERSKPQYESYSASSFVSVRDFGATGNGQTDDTSALQAAIDNAASSGLIVFVDAGTYLVTDTIKVPASSRIVGESYSVIMSSGSTFSDINNPVPVVQIAQGGDIGIIEWSDMIVSTQGAQAGAILIEWNLAGPVGSPAGMWDVHARIGGFAGSNLQLDQCPTTNTTAATASNINENCIAAFMSMHITRSASNVYLENVWLWTADHDVEDPGLTQITVYTGRGLYVESTAGTIWLYGTAVEHHSLYQYQFANTQNIYMGQIQTETPYYQPNPDATLPFPTVASLNDPTFTESSSANTANAWGLRILDSSDILVYGAGLYSFFNNYNVECSQVGQGEACQNRIFSVEGECSVDLYSLNTVGTTEMITFDGTDEAVWSDNVNGFIDSVTLFRTSGGL